MDGFSVDMNASSCPVPQITMNHKLDKETPRFDVQLSFDEIGVLLDDNQYRDVISLVDMYHFYIRQHQVSFSLCARDRKIDDMTSHSTKNTAPLRTSFRETAPRLCCNSLPPPSWTKFGSANGNGRGPTSRSDGTIASGMSNYSRRSNSAL